MHILSTGCKLSSLRRIRTIHIKLEFLGNFTQLTF
nr:MAG TPA: hypothetical protein [Caudoviricetes sp.]